MPRVLHVLCTVLFGINVHGWSQTPPPSTTAQVGSSADAPSWLLEPPLPRPHQDSHPVRLPSPSASPSSHERTSVQNQDDQQDESSASELEGFMLPDVATFALPTPAAERAKKPQPEIQRPAVQNALATDSSVAANPVRPIASYISDSTSSNRIVRYEIPLDDLELNQTFLERGIEGQLIEVRDESQRKNKSLSDRLDTFLRPVASWNNTKKVRVVRYEVPADDIFFHSQLTELDGQLLEPGMLRLPEVRFFQPKARVFMDLKQSNDGEFDLFNDGAILASLDVIELYFPMPLISERFADMFGKSGQLSSLGWRVGGTLGLGISTALNNGTSDIGSAPVSTLSTGIRYEFPLGRPSQELLETRDIRLDQRTRVGMVFGLQGGISTRESLQERTDVGLYFGILVNTPWGG